MNIYTVTGKAITVLRLLSRERAGFDACLTNSCVDNFAKHAGLDVVLAPDYTHPSVVESLKLLANLQVHDEELRTYFTGERYIYGLPSLFNPARGHCALIHIASRLMFLAAATNTTFSQLFIKQDIPDQIAEFLHDISRSKMEYSDGLNRGILTIELLKLSFAISISFSSQNESPMFGIPAKKEPLNVEDTQKFVNLLGVTIKICKEAQPAQKAALRDDTIEACINVLMNLPVAELGNVWFPKSNLDFVTFIADCFDETVRYMIPKNTKGSDIEDANVDGVPMDQILSPCLVLLKHLAEGSGEARKLLKGRYMPNNLYKSINIGTVLNR